MPIAAFLLLFGFQAWNLDSDPSPIKRMGDFFDEGYWQHNARCSALFGTWLPDDFNQAFIGAPLFSGLQRGFFCLGVNLFVARLLPLIAFWLVLLMLFDVLRRELPEKSALAVVLSLGIMHEMLMYVKWSTPLLPETACHVAVLYFTDRAVRKGPIWMLAAGLSAAAAFAMKLSAFNSAVGILAFVIGSGLLRREIGKSGLLGFVAGWLTGMASLAAFLLWNLQQFQFFRHTIGAANVDRPWHAIRVPLDIALFPINQIFSHPGVLGAAILASLWLCSRLSRAWRGGALALLRSMTRTEFFCFCWLIGAAVVLGASPDKADRRYVSLLVPLVILAGMFACQAWSSPGHSHTASVAAYERRGSLAARVPFFLACGFYWSALFRNAFDILALIGFDRNFRAQRLAIWSVCMVAGFLLSALCHLASKQRLVVRGTIVAFLAFALVMDGIWYGNATWTVRNASQRLAQITAAKEYIIGSCAHELAIENHTLPLWSPLTPGTPMNQWFADSAAHLQFVEIDEETDAAVRPQPTTFGAAFHLPSDHLDDLGHFRLCPSALTGKPRLDLRIYRWQP